MGTKVQCKSYPSGHYSMGNLNEGSSSWYYEDRTLSGHLYNGFMLKPVNAYSEYDKEMLKRTMLEHEAVFRKQVYELHRLYRIQKDLMDELKKKELNRFSIPMDTSQSKLFSSHPSSEVTDKSQEMPYLASGNTSYNKPSAPSANELGPSYFLKENNMQSSPTPSVNGASLKGKMLDPKLTKFPRKMFDLQLPADAYIDNEDAGKAEKENLVNSSFRVTDSLNINGIAEPENDVKLTLSFGEDPCNRKDSWKSESHPKNGLLIHRLADLNEPIRDICCGGEARSSAAQFLNMRTHYEQMQGHRFPNYANQHHGDFFADMHRNEGTRPNFSSADMEKTRQEWPLFHNEVGKSTKDATSFNPGLCTKNLPLSSKPIPLMHTRFHETDLPHQNKTVTWFGDKAGNDIEISGRNPHLANSIYSRPTVPKSPGTFSVVPHSYYFSTKSPTVSSWQKPMKNVTDVPIAVQALPCFTGSAARNVQSKSSCLDVQNLSNVCGKRTYNGDFRPNSASLLPITFHIPDLNDHGGKPTFGNSEGHGKCFNSLQCSDVKPAVDVSLNPVLTNGMRDGLTGHPDIVRNNEELSGEISWFRTKPACGGSADVKKCASQMESSFSGGYSQLLCSYDSMASETKKKLDKGKGHSLWALQNSESRMQRNEASDSLNGERIFGFPILDKVCQSPVHSLSSNDTSCSEKHGLHHDFPYDVKVPSLGKQLHVASLVTGEDVVNSSKDLRNHINLNSAVSCMEISKSSGNSSDYEAKVPSPFSGIISDGKNACEIDLETPIVAQAEGSMNSQEEAIGMNHLEVPVQVALDETVGQQKTECSSATFDREAAENLVAMSLYMGRYPDDITQPLTPASYDCLHWFAEFASSYAQSSRVSKGGDYGDAEMSDDDGLDYFESMTLKLKEMKPEEYWCRPQHPENQKDGEMDAASQLLTKPRRGQARKRRQRRDFQKDILPGLVSLSRHEVTEDLQAFGGLMRSSGRSSQANLARRNTSRNGFSCQGRGRRQPRSLAVTVEEIHVNSTPAQPTLAGLELDMTITGWGRTRRCRRQRVPSGNAPVLLT